MNARQATNAARGRALDLWQAPAGAGEPIICIATTFTFDATFFETECLGRFLQMDTHPQESEAVGYLIEREEKLAAARVTVLVDRSKAEAKESLRWDILPVFVQGAVQHAKISLLCWSDHVRVIVSSGNLTESGYRKNLEVFGALDATRIEGGQVEEIRQCVDFLDKVVDRAVGDASRPGPIQRTQRALAAVRTHVNDWPRASRSGVIPVPIFGGLGTPVFEEVRRQWPVQSPPREARILSPFFDRAGNETAITSGLLGVLAKRRPRSTRIAVPFEDLADGRTRLFVTYELVQTLSAQCDVTLEAVAREQDDELRDLHAKMLIFSNDTWNLILVGSSNFTRAGYGETVQGNLEANLAYLVRADSQEWRALRKIWPDIARQIDIGAEDLVWQPAFDDDEGVTGAVLPLAFCEALFDAGAITSRLIVLLGDGLPPSWRIKSADDVILLDSADGAGSGEHAIAWTDRSVPFVLKVEWETELGAHAADWPVNVLEPSSLPPEALRDLTLDELVEILGATRPLHLAVVEALKRRGRRAVNQSGRELHQLLDPHKRINPTTLLRRTKRVSLALERLRERLERPVLSRDALEWRFAGPVGPLALAKALESEAETPVEAQFFLAELALAISRVRTAEPAKGGITEAEVREALRRTIGEVERRARAFSTQKETAVDRYVNEALQEANR